MSAKRFMICFFIIVSWISCSKQPELPGPVKEGTRLPNRWMLTPAGKHIPVGDLPLNIALSPDGKTLAVTNNGFSKQFISLIDTEQDTVITELDVDKAFFGLSFSPDGQYLYASGGGDEQVLVWKISSAAVIPQPSISLTDSSAPVKIFPAGIAISNDGAVLYVAENRNERLSMVSAGDKQVIKRIQVGPYPYDVKLAGTLNKLFVSLWGGSRVCVVDCLSGEPVTEIKVGDHPNAMMLSSDESLLYVACANTDEVAVIDTKKNEVIETIGLHPYPNAPFGSTPNALVLSPDDSKLFVANATNNDVAVIDVSNRGESVVKGLIPVGWYPTALAISKDGARLYVANAKGLTSKPNPGGPDPNKKQDEKTEYIAGLFNGTISVIPVPDNRQLALYTKQVEKNNGFNEAARKLTDKKQDVKPQAIPRRVGEVSLIKHVIYILKENRTYDQVLGDLSQGNGDPSICLFDRDVTPNHHALAEEFVLLDNFYVDAEVSADGHEWSTAAIATDFVEKTWPTVYSGRGLPYPSEGSHEIAFPTSGYIWEAVANKGLSYRSYGEFISLENNMAVAQHSSLEGHFDPLFKPWDLSYPDTLRTEEFIRELHEFERNGELPNFIILRLPNDHTAGTNPGMSTPRAMVAENDIALGRIVEAVSNSRFWKDTAIFVIEDDAQNGPDHVDAHRTIAFAISPYIRRGIVDNTLYDTASMLRTMELILGLHPMSQYDAAAFPMVACFTDKADLTPYKSLYPKVPLDEVNTTMAYGAAESIAMDFSREDATPEIRLNEIIWKSIRGEESEMPRPINHRVSYDEDDMD
ncbi:MAG: beta-propeller fold lactonase family protein [Candidatus Latescibacteria bacterium]|nr:beta-propeller fold lactonase family protein [Candidatus Latescibacterota bacterium]